MSDKNLEGGRIIKNLKPYNNPTFLSQSYSIRRSKNVSGRAG
jgi:hypothetical protein